MSSSSSRQSQYVRVKRHKTTLFVTFEPDEAGECAFSSPRARCQPLSLQSRRSLPSALRRFCARLPTCVSCCPAATSRSRICRVPALTLASPTTLCCGSRCARTLALSLKRPTSCRTRWMVPTLTMTRQWRRECVNCSVHLQSRQHSSQSKRAYLTRSSPMRDPISWRSAASSRCGSTALRSTSTSVGPKSAR